jgi:hypothetical protein
MCDLVNLYYAAASQKVVHFRDIFLVEFCWVCLTISWVRLG